MHITDELFDAFIRCETKAHLKLTGGRVDQSEYLGWQQDHLQTYLQKCQLHLRASLAEHADVTDPSTHADLKRTDVRLFLNCTLEAEQIRASIHAVERLPSPAKGTGQELVPIRFVPRTKVTRHDKFLLAFAGLALSRATGGPCTCGKIIYGHQPTTLRVKLDDLIKTVTAMIGTMAEQLSAGCPPPLVLNRHCPECQFQGHCRQMATETDELTLLGSMTATERKKLHSKGIFTVTQLSYTFRPRRKPKRLGDRSEKHHHALKALAIRQNRIHITGQPRLEVNGTPVYLDVESDPDRDFYYLIGLRIGNGQTAIQYSLWAIDKAQEAEIWASFLKILSATEDPQLVHYGSYETDFLRRMKQRYSVPVASSQSIDRLMATALNVLSVVYWCVYFPTYSNSLKEVAHYLGFQWSDQSGSGLNAIAWRRQWEYTEDATLKQRLITYNAEDCEALERVTTVVRSLFGRQAEETQSVLNVVDASSLKREHPYRFAFGNKDFALPEFQYINQAAYWDYQHDRVYVRSGSKLKETRQQHLKGPGKPLPIDKTIECSRPASCPSCSATAFYRHSKRTKVVHDLRFVRAGVKRWIVRYSFHRYICPHCSATFYSGEKNWMRSRHGWNLLAYVVYLLTDLQLSHGTISQNLNQLFDLRLNRLTIKRLKSRAAQFYANTYQKILNRIVTGELVHADETSVSIRGVNSYVWVLTSLYDVAYIFSPTREGDVIQELLKDFTGVLVSDFYPAYDVIGCAQQKCLIHLMRDLNEDLFKRQFDEELKQIARDFGCLLRGMVDTVDKHGLNRRFLCPHKVEVDLFYRNIESYTYHSDVAAGYKRRFARNRERLFTFLDHDNVPWNNNNAEHAIKSFASLRNVIMGSSTAKGIREYLILLSIRETCRVKGVNFLEFLRTGEENIDGFILEGTTAGHRRWRTGS
jgi:predicted RecB family nuclease